MDSRQAIAPAASPQIVEIVRAPGATSRRVPHLGHSTPNENAITIGAEISVLQCGHVRTATTHLRVTKTNNNRIRRAKKGKTTALAEFQISKILIPALRDACPSKLPAFFDHVTNARFAGLDLFP